MSDELAERPGIPWWQRPGSGQVLQGIGGIVGPLVQALLPQRGTTLEQLQCKLLELQVAREAERAAVPFATLGWPNLVDGDRQDWVVLGRRGSGKTAAAVAIAAANARCAESPLLLPGWPEWASAAVGGASCSVRDAKRAKRSWIVWDEASLRIPPGRREGGLFELLALARQRGNSCVWTSQTSSAVHRDVLRMGAAYLFKPSDPIARLLDREELVDVHAQAESIMLRHPPAAEIDGGVVLLNGMWGAVSGIPLPEGWCEEVSRLWA